MTRTKAASRQRESPRCGIQIVMGVWALSRLRLGLRESEDYKAWNWTRLEQRRAKAEQLEYQQCQIFTMGTYKEARYTVMCFPNGK